MVKLQAGPLLCCDLDLQPNLMHSSLSEKVLNAESVLNMKKEIVMTDDKVCPEYVLTDTQMIILKT